MTEDIAKSDAERAPRFTLGDALITIAIGSWAIALVGGCLTLLFALAKDML